MHFLLEDQMLTQCISCIEKIFSEYFLAAKAHIPSPNWRSRPSRLEKLQRSGVERLASLGIMGSPIPTREGNPETAQTSRHYDTEGLQRRPSIGPSLYRETSFSWAADANYSSPAGRGTQIVIIVD